MKKSVPVWSRPTVFASLLALAVTACGGADAAAIPGEEPNAPQGGEVAQGGATPDTSGAGSDHGGSPAGGPTAPGVAPKIIAVSPTDGTKGVRDDAVVKIKFSAPMDAASTESTWKSDDIGDVAFAWNEAGDELTVTPVTKLAYALGEARAYTYAIGLGAKAAGGGQVANGVSATFTMLRDDILNISPDGEMSGSFRESNLKNLKWTVGDRGIPTANVTDRIFLTFPLEALPQDAELLGATVTARQLAIEGQPYTDLGLLQFRATTYADTSAVFTSPVLGPVVQFTSAPSDTSKTVDVLAQTQSEIAEGDGRVQLRLSFQKATDTDGLEDSARFDGASFTLSLHYLAP